MTFHFVIVCVTTHITTCCISITQLHKHSCKIICHLSTLFYGSNRCPFLLPNRLLPTHIKFPYHQTSNVAMGKFTFSCLSATVLTVFFRPGSRIQDQMSWILRLNLLFLHFRVVYLKALSSFYLGLQTAS